jgi:hypothetical protein
MKVLERKKRAKKARAKAKPYKPRRSQLELRTFPSGKPGRPSRVPDFLA